MDLPLYLDHHSTTPVDPRIVDAMLPFLRGPCGNPASRQHVYGRRAYRACEHARGQVAALIGAESREIVFTSGATESDNLALKGVAHALREKGRDHLVVTAIEHKAVLDSARHLEREGFRLTVLEPDAMGRVSAEQVAEVLEDRTALVSVMLANNEVGSVQPIADIGRLTRERGVLLHTDAAQGLGWVPFDVDSMAVDLVSISAHKVYGPKGVGALYVRRRNPRVAVVAQQDGGGQEGGRRSGTLNVPGIVGLGAACELAATLRSVETPRLGALRDRLWDALEARIDGTRVFGPPRGTRRLPHNLNVSFEGVQGDALLVALAPYLALSSGSACASASVEPSYVLRAMGIGADRAEHALRIGLGRSTTEDAVDFAAERFEAAVRELRRGVS